MGVAVTEAEVFAAADAVLARGERPTRDRVRAELGRGSPVRVGQMVEAWWVQAAQRMAQRLALPAVPDSVAEAFAHAWDVAVAAGQVHAEALVAPERAALAEVLARAEGALSDHRAQIAVLEGRLSQVQSTADKHYADWRVSDVQVGQLTRQLGALEQEQQALVVRRDALEARNVYLEKQLESLRAAAATERETLQAHVRQIEDRAAIEIDRAREETKAVRRELAVLQREHQQTIKTLQSKTQTAHGLEKRVAAAEARVQGLASRLVANKARPRPVSTPRTRAATGPGARTKRATPVAP